MSVTGTCLCGGLRYAIDGSLGLFKHCHCGMCRKHHGAPFATTVSVPIHNFRWLQGEANVHEYASSTTRVRRFCGACGSVAPTAVGEQVLVPVGNFLGELNNEGTQHVFVSSKAPWHVIADDAPQQGSNCRHTATPVEACATDSQPADTTQGSCLCGEITFSAVGRPSRWLQCHCSRCRLARSAVHGSNTFYSKDQFRWLTGRDLVREFKPLDAERFTTSFCVRCGGATPVEFSELPFVLVPASIFDENPAIRPEAHVFVGSKASWYSFADELPQFVELPLP